jgi:hypothetical protein
MALAAGWAWGECTAKIIDAFMSMCVRVLMTGDIFDVLAGGGHNGLDTLTAKQRVCAGPIKQHRQRPRLGGAVLMTTSSGTKSRCEPVSSVHHRRRNLTTPPLKAGRAGDERMG